MIKTQFCNILLRSNNTIVGGVTVIAVSEGTIQTEVTPLLSSGVVVSNGYPVSITRARLAEVKEEADKLLNDDVVFEFVGRSHDALLSDVQECVRKALLEAMLTERAECHREANEQRVQNEEAPIFNFDEPEEIPQPEILAIASRPDPLGGMGRGRKGAIDLGGAYRRLLSLTSRVGREVVNGGDEVWSEAYPLPISQAAQLLGLSKWRARRALQELNDRGVLRYEHGNKKGPRQLLHGVKHYGGSVQVLIDRR